MTTILPHVCFIGAPGAGKTTAAELLVKNFAYERLSFATPLKVACGTSTDRALLQDVGMGVRALHEDFWVNLLIADFEARSSRASWAVACDRTPNLERYVVDDGRFPNEIIRLRMEGFIVVRVRAHYALRVMRLRANGKLQDESRLDHQVEHAIDDLRPDYTIENGDDPETLLEQVVTIVNRERR